MDMLPPEQMAFLIPNLLGMLEALFIVWVIFTVEKWRGKKEVRKLAAQFLAPHLPVPDPDVLRGIDTAGLQLLEAEAAAATADARVHMENMKKIINSHQKPAAAGE